MTDDDTAFITWEEAAELDELVKVPRPVPINVKHPPGRSIDWFGPGPRTHRTKRKKQRKTAR